LRGARPNHHASVLLVLDASYLAGVMIGIEMLSFGA